MKCGENGKKLIKSFEGCNLKAYQDLGGKWTIGVGHKSSDVVEGLTWTQDQADAQFEKDLYDRAEKYINSMVMSPLNQNQYDALVSFVFNVGSNNFGSSTLLRMLNKSYYEQIPLQMMFWIHVNGVASGGLARRRQAEAKLWNQAVGTANDNTIA